MVDMSKTVEAKSDQLNADDLIGGARTIRIRDVKDGGTAEQPISIFFDGDNNKPFKPCKSMRRLLIHLWGNDGKKYIGKLLTIYREPTVKWGGKDVGGVRISHASHIEKAMTFALTESKANRRPHTVHPIKGDQQAAQQQQTQEPAQITPETKAAGKAAADQGVAAYTEWLAKLSPDVKATVRPFHQDFTATAKAADEANKPKDEIPFGDDDEDDKPAM